MPKITGSRGATGARAAKWLRIATAAPLLDLTPGALRARLERAVRRGPPGDGPIPIGLGVVARRLGRHWRLRLPAEVDHDRSPLLSRDPGA